MSCGRRYEAYVCARCKRPVYWAEGHACLQTFKRETDARIPEPLVNVDPGDENDRECVCGEINMRHCPIHSVEAA